MPYILPYYPANAVPCGTYIDKFVFGRMEYADREDRGSWILYVLEAKSPIHCKAPHCLTSSFLIIGRQDKRFYNERLRISGEEIDGLLNEDGTVNADIPVEKEVEVTVKAYLDRSLSVGPSRWFQVSRVKRIRRAEPVPPAPTVRKPSPPTRSKVSRKSGPVALHADAFAKMYPGIAALRAAVPSTPSVFQT